MESLLAAGVRSASLAVVHGTLPSVVECAASDGVLVVVVRAWLAAVTVRASAVATVGSAVTLTVVHAAPACACGRVEVQALAGAVATVAAGTLMLHSAGAADVDMVPPEQVTQKLYCACVAHRQRPS